MDDDDIVPLTGPADPAGLSVALGRVRAGHAAKGYLGDPQTVEDYLKGFCHGVLEQMSQAADGTITREQASANVETSCEQAAEVFLGRDPDYTPVGPWNTEGELAYSIRSKYAAQMAGGDGTPESAVKGLFALLALDVYRLPAVEQAGATPAEIQEHVDTALEGVAHALLGILDDD